MRNVIRNDNTDWVSVGRKHGREGASMLILNGGGDEGGWVFIDGHWIYIPPWSPDVRRQLWIISELMQVRAVVKDPALNKEMGILAERISAALIPGALKGSGQHGNAVTSVLFLRNDGHGFATDGSGKSLVSLAPSGSRGSV